MRVLKVFMESPFGNSYKNAFSSEEKLREVLSSDPTFLSKLRDKVINRLNHQQRPEGISVTLDSILEFSVGRVSPVQYSEGYGSCRVSVTRAMVTTKKYVHHPEVAVPGEPYQRPRTELVSSHTGESDLSDLPFYLEVEYVDLDQPSKED